MLRNFLLLASTLFFFTGVGAHGAEFRMVATSGDQEEFARINLTGAIVSGDAEKLQAIFDREMSGYFFDTHYVTLTMDSLGGSFSEAIKLMDMFGRVKIATRVAKDASCLSACAVAFMGGNRVIANVHSINRIVEPGGRLGFHAPSLNLSGDTLVPAPLLQSSYANALGAIAGILERRDLFQIQTSLVETIISTPPEEIYTLETVDDFARWNIAVEIDQSTWKPDETDVSRMCLNSAAWRSGASISDLEKTMSLQQGAPSHDERIREWANMVRFYEPNGQPGLKTVFAYASEVGMNISTCVVKLVNFRGQWYPTVFLSNSSVETAINSASQSNSNDGTYMLHALPHDFRISALR